MKTNIPLIAALFMSSFASSQVGIHTDTPIAPLDVRGAVRGGTPNTSATVGLNSAAFGTNNEASGVQSFAVGMNNTVTGIRSAAFGATNVISDRHTFAFGQTNTVSRAFSMAIGQSNIVSGGASLALGISNEALSMNTLAIGGSNIVAGSFSTTIGRSLTARDSENQFVIGRGNAVRMGSGVAWGPTDPLFQIGNADVLAVGNLPNNALTILKNAHTGIGIIGQEAAAKPTEMLDIGSEGVRIRDINTAPYQGDIQTDRLVVANTNGILKTLPDTSSLAIEPWQVENTTNKATGNTQNIYQNGNVGIGNFSTSTPIAPLDVRGSVRGGSPNTSATVGTNSAAFGSDNVASGTQSFAVGQGNTASGIRSAAFGTNNTASGINAFAAGQGNVVSQNNTAFGSNNTISGANYAFVSGIGNTVSGAGSVSFGGANTVNSPISTAIGRNLRAIDSENQFVIGRSNAIQTGSGAAWDLTDPLFQIGNSIVSGQSNNAITVLKSGRTGIGIIGTEAAAKPTEMLDIGSEGVRIRDINTVPYQGNTQTDRPVVADANGVLKTVDATASVFGQAVATTTNLNAIPSGTWVEVTNAQITLPQAGTYMISADVITSVDTSSGGNTSISARLFNVTDGTMVPNTLRILSQSINYASGNHTAPVTTYITVTGPTTIRLEAQKNIVSGTPTAHVFSNPVAGLTTLGFHKL